MKWITNAKISDGGQYIATGKIISRPRSVSPYFSVESLEASGYIGVYDPDIIKTPWPDLGKIFSVQPMISAQTYRFVNRKQYGKDFVTNQDGGPKIGHWRRV